jgi:rhamnulokinase
LLARFGLPTHILGKLTPPGTRLGRLRKSVAEETGLADAEVVLPGTHDTASAVMAVPVDAGATAESGSHTTPQQGRGRETRAQQGFAKPTWCYISSGTWSLMGVEVPEPVINDTCYRLNFTNEGGVGGTTRLLKNIAGMWLVQECRRIWQLAGRTFEWDELVALAERSPPHGPLINPDDARFVAPRDMPAAIAEFARESGQGAPQSEGAFVRCAFESLALRYRMVLTWLEQLIEGPIDTIHIVGGGAHNRLLCQMAADATGRRVVAGPTEATAIGNLMMQAVAAGDVDSIAEARQVIRDSFDLESYEPRDSGAWDESYGRFQKLLSE